MPKSGPGRGRLRCRATWAAVLVGVCGVTAACAVVPSTGPEARSATVDGPVVLTTFTVLADMAQVVAGPGMRVESITGPGTEIHGYEPTPDDLRRAAEADLLLANGLGLEAWLEALVAPLDLPTVVLTDAVQPLPIRPDGTAVRPGNRAAAVPAGEAAADGAAAGRAAADGAAGTDPDAPLDPHAWMSPRTGRLYVEAIARALTDLDPAGADGYRERADRYAAELDALHDELGARLADVPPERRVLVTCEGAFSYLARDAGLATAYLWPVNAEQQATPRRVGSLITTVREAEVAAVFCESTVSATAQRQVARETGARFGGTLYVDSLSLEGGPVPTYLDLLRHDVEVITAGLTAGPR